MAEVLQIVDDLNGRGVNLVSLTDGVDATTSTGRLLLGVLVAAAEYERNLISERTIADALGAGTSTVDRARRALREEGRLA